jgi:ABC-type nitrate/sulfonate/bicarbonate transport system substrate-binding protein
MKFCAGFVALLAVMSASSATQAAAQQTVRLAMLAPNALLWPHAVATAKGFYAEKNIKVEELRTASSPALLQAVSSGSVEAGLSLGDLVIRAIDQGAPIIMTGAIMGKSTLRLVGGPGINSIKDLNGQNVTAGAVEGGTASLLRFMLKRAGVDPRAVKMMSVAASGDRLVALENGQVRGALLTAPFDGLAVRKNMKILDSYAEPYQTTPLIVNTNWSSRNRAAAEGLTQALRKASDWIYDPANRKEAIQLLADYTKSDFGICEDAYEFLILKQKAIGEGLQVTAASLENILAIDQALGASPAGARTFNLNRYYDASYLGGK